MKSFKLLMKNTVVKHSGVLLLVLVAAWHARAHAADTAGPVRLMNETESVAFWNTRTPEMPPKYFDAPYNPYAKSMYNNSSWVRGVIMEHAREHSAIKDHVYINGGYGAQLMDIGESRYAVMSVMTMPQSYSGEKCTHLNQKEAIRRGHPYLCAEGQIGYKACLLYFIDDQYRIQAVHRIPFADPKPGYPAFCMGVMGFGLGNKDTGSVLVTVQYHDTHSPLANSIQTLGDGWMRTTRLLRFRHDDGKLSVEEDYRCLPQDNRFPDIPTARKALRQCPVAVQ